MEVLDKEDEGHTPEESAEESSEYEEYTGKPLLGSRLMAFSSSRHFIIKLLGI